MQYILEAEKAKGADSLANMAHIRQSRPDSGLGLSHFPGQSPQNLVGCCLTRSAVGVGELNFKPYRGTSLIRNSAPIGPYRGTKHRALWWL